MGVSVGCGEGVRLVRDREVFQLTHRAVTLGVRLVHDREVPPGRVGPQIEAGVLWENGRSPARARWPCHGPAFFLLHTRLCPDWCRRGPIRRLFLSRTRLCPRKCFGERRYGPYRTGAVPDESGGAGLSAASVHFAVARLRVLLVRFGHATKRPSRPARPGAVPRPRLLF